MHGYYGRGECPHGHRAKANREVDGQGRVWITWSAPAKCPLCPDGLVLERFSEELAGVTGSSEPAD